MSTQSRLKRVGLVASNHTGYVKAMFECMQAGNIAVPLRNIDDRDRIEAASVNQVVTPTPSGDWMRPTFTPPTTDSVALISFTSGTEGTPKGVILTHQNLANVVERLNALMQVNDDIREYIGVPVYHSFGFGRCRAIATAGGQFFIPSNGFNPSEIGTMLKNGEINAISAVPSLWRVLLANKDAIGHYGKRVRWIEIGSQYMSRQEKEAIKSLFPEARIVQHYGLTEASRTTLLEIHAVEGEALESVGQALGGVAIKLTSEGQIAIQGAHVAKGYLIDGKETHLPNDDGWFLTKDLGHIENGYLYYKGRADDVINCGGIKVHPETLETKVYASIGYSNGLAICRKTDPIRGDGFLVAVTKDVEVDRQHLREAVLQATQSLGVNAGNSITVIDVDSLPKTATGKIQRRQLAEWYAKEFSQQNQPAASSLDPAPAADASIRTIFCQTLNLQQIKPQDTFISLGGDSLSYVQVSMDIESHLGYLPSKWEQMPLSELEKLVPQRRFNTTIEADILLRALAICGIVFNQSGLHLLEGGALLLLLIAGVNFSRFQGCSLIQGRLYSIFPPLKHILIPYWILAFAYQVYSQRFDPLILSFLGNFQIPELQNSNSIFFVWFVANLVQTIILFSLPFSIKAVRQFARLSPWRYGLITFGIGVATHLVGPYVWDTSYVYDQVPHMLVWLFSLGWCVHFAKSKTEKIITTAIAFIGAASFIGFEGLHSWWVFIGSVMLLWLPSVGIPSIIKTPIQMVGAASYYIYLTTMIFVHVISHVLGIENPWITAVLTLLGGVFIWSSIQSIQQFVAYKRVKKANYADFMQY